MLSSLCSFLLPGVSHVVDFGLFLICLSIVCSTYLLLAKPSSATSSIRDTNRLCECVDNLSNTHPSLTWKTVAPVAGVGRLSAGSSVHAGRRRTGDVQLFTFGARKPRGAVATVRARDVHAHATLTAQ